MKKSIFFIAIMISIFAFSCCNSSKKAAKSNNLPLIGTQWNLVSIENEDISNEFALRPFLTFDSAGNVGGNLGCNTLFGEYQLLKKNKIKLEYKGATKRLCQKMEVEKKFMNALRMEINQYQISGDELILLSDKIEVMRFKGVDLNKAE